MARIAAKALIAGDRNRILAAMIWSSLTVMAIVLVSRKFAGAYSHDLPATAVCFVSTITVALSLIADILYHSSRPPHRSKRGQIAAGVITLVPPFAMGSTLLPAHSIAAASFLGILFLLASCGLLAVGEITRRQDIVTQTKASHMPSPSSAFPFSITEAMHRIASPRVGEEHSTLSQWMTRNTDPNGSESVAGEVTIEFPAGQKHVSIHFPFCPPFSRTPRVVCDLLGDTQARVRVATVRSYGVRLEAKRVGTCETDASVKVRISAEDLILRGSD